MDDKLIEELDVDFMSEILGTTELQMADNLIHDLMGEYNQVDSIFTSNHIQTIESQTNSNDQIWVNNEYNTQITTNPNYLNQTNFYPDGFNQISPNNQIQINNGPVILGPIINEKQINFIQSTEASYTNSNTLPVNLDSNPNLVIISNNNNAVHMVEPQNIFLLNNNNNNNENTPKRVRKNLKDILEDSPKISNQIYFQNTEPQQNQTNHSTLSSLINSSNNLNRNDLITVSPVLSPQNFQMPLTPPSPLTSLQQQQQLQQVQQIQILNETNSQNSLNDKIYQLNPSNIQIVTDFVMNTNSFNSNTSNLKSQATVRKVPSSSSLPLNETIQMKPQEQSKSKAEPKSRSRAHNENKPKSEPVKHDESVDSNGKKVKVPKRTSHNAIEKKYRSSINDKIVELKIRVAGPEAKLQKSGILKRALEHINSIEDSNKRLTEENKTFRSALQTISANINNPLIIQNVIRNVNLNKPIESKSNLDMPNTPPSSSSSSDADSLFSMSDTESSLSQPQTPVQTHPEKRKPQKSYQTQPKQKTYKKLKKDAMLDSSRIMLCMFVMSVLFFNPFNLVISPESTFSNQASYGEYQNLKPISSRVLNSFGDENSENSFNTTKQTLSNPYFNLHLVLSWTLNILLVIFCLIRVYISGESYIELTDQNEETIWLNYQKASKNFQKKNYEQAFEHCENGLKELGQSIPKTKLKLILGIVWQLNRLWLNKIYIGILFTKLGIWLYGLRSFKMYKLCALFYYELHKFSYLNMKDENDFVLKTTTATTLIYTNIYSFLASIYYTLAIYNTSEIYTRLDKNAKEMTTRDEYNLCEFYFSMVLFLKFHLPSRVSKAAVKYLIKDSLMSKLTEEREENGQCKLKKLKDLLKKAMFIHYLINFEDYSYYNQNFKNNDVKKQKILNFILYKRKLLSSSYLYDADDKLEYFDFEQKVSTVNGVACDFVLSKFQDFILIKMTNHIINQSGMISIDRILNNSVLVNTAESLVQNQGKSPIDLDEEQKEMADVDQIKFEKLKMIYEKNLDYFSASELNRQTNKVQQETHSVLIEFLNMLNKWKLRKFDFKCCTTEKFTNSCNSSFVDSIISALKAYESLNTRPDQALLNCKNALNMLKNFDLSNNYNSHSYLVEKFELLIYDWILSAQTYLWSQHKIYELELFNQSLQKFKNSVLNYPELIYKVKLYETILMYSSNRNPINLLNTTNKPNVISKCNQEAFFSMNTILKKFHLQMIE